MTILYLITKGEQGGAQSHLWSLMNLQRFGTPVLALGDDGFLANQARSAGTPVHIIPHLVHPIDPWRDLQALWELLRIVRLEQPGLIHAHTAKAGMLARAVGFLTGTPTVYTVHAWSFTGMRSPILRTLSLWLERVLSLLNQTVIDVSQANFKMAEREAVAPRGKHLVIWNGVPDTPHRASLAASESLVDIIMVARFAPPKDHCILLEALASLPRTWRCTFVGSGPTLADVQARVELLGLEDRVRFLGDRHDVAELLAQSHLFVLCSKSESLPISILEAMRAGLPVIASAVGGCAELVTDGVSGLLATPGDVLHLRQCLTKMLNSCSLRQSFGREGRARYGLDFRVESMIRKTVSAYSRIAPLHVSGLAAANASTPK